ncbi:MAG: ferritin family protein [Planctomycetota bacterium]
MAVNEMSAADLLDLACQVESNGVEFYRRSAELASDPKAEQFLRQLAVMEEDHLQVFSAMKENWLARQSAAAEGDQAAQPDESVRSYLEMLASDRLFDPAGGPAKTWTGQERLTDVIARAVEMESDSILFYVGLKEYVPNADQRAKIDDIIHQEMGHATSLKNLLMQLRDEEK